MSVRSGAELGSEAERLEAVQEWARAQLGDDAFAARVAAGRDRDVAAAAVWSLDLLANLRP